MAPWARVARGTPVSTLSWVKEGHMGLAVVHCWGDDASALATPPPPLLVMELDRDWKAADTPAEARLAL